MHRSTAARVAILVVVTVGSLAWAAWGADARAVGRALWTFDSAVLAGVFGLFALSFAGRVVRFRALLPPIDGRRLSVLEVTPAVGAGGLAVVVLPFRLGEFVKPWLLHDAHRVPIGHALAAVVAERLLDVVALGLILVAASASGRLASGAVIVGGVDLMIASQRALAVTLVLGVLAALGLAVAGDAGVRASTGISDWIWPRATPLVASLVGRLAEGFRSLAARPGEGALAAAATVIVWSGSLGGCGVLIRAFDELPGDVGAILVNFAATVGAIVLGPTPGHVGPFEAGAVASLVAMGAPPDASRALALVHHGCTFTFTLVVGLAAIASQGWSVVGAMSAWKREA